MLKNRISLYIAITIFIIIVIGFIMIYSASSYSANIHWGDSFYYVKKQLVGFMAGIVVFTGAVYIKLEWLYKFKNLILLFGTIMLGLVFIPGLGMESYGAMRWINLGFITIQPSEVCKFCLVIYIAGYLSSHDASKWRTILVVLFFTGAQCLLIMLEPNMSITMCVCLVVFIMLAVGGMKRNQIALLILPFIIGVVALIILEPYRLQRLMAFIDPWATPKAEGYQLIQSYYAIGSGGLFGVGLFNSRQKFLFLPFAESDFIFSIICEELGLIGCIAIISLYIILIYLGSIVAIKARNQFQSLLAIGIVAVIAVQSLLNIAVVSGSIPPTGLPLPFISAGGSALAVFMGASGLLINISNSKFTHKSHNP